VTCGIRGWFGRVLRQPFTLAVGLLPAWLLAAIVLTRWWLRWRNLGVSHASRGRQHHGRQKGHRKQ